MTFSPSRLTLARERLGLSKAALADLCEVSRRAVTDWESGKVDHPPAERIAAALGVDVEFLTGPEIVQLTPDLVSFRALSSMSARQSKIALATSQMSSLLHGWLTERYNTPAVEVPVVDELSDSEVRPTEAAALLRSAWSLPPKPIASMVGLLERKGVRILSLPPAQRDIDAFSYWRDGVPHVFLNQDKSAERLRFDLAHELGHLVMHASVTTARERRYEGEANEFASSFLMPPEPFTAQALTGGGELRLSDITVIKKSWRVSAVAVVRRLKDVGLINDWQYRTWMVDLSSRGYRRSEPDGISPERSSVLTDCLRFAREDGWSVRTIAHDVGIPAGVLEDALSGLTLLPLDGAGRGPGNDGKPTHLTAVR